MQKILIEELSNGGFQCIALDMRPHELGYQVVGIGSTTVLALKNFNDQLWQKKAAWEQLAVEARRAERSRAVAEAGGLFNYFFKRNRT